MLLMILDPRACSWNDLLRRCNNQKSAGGRFRSYAPRFSLSDC
jgi:hypothetical protein